MLLALALLLQDKWLFEEKFAGKPGKGWSWVREDVAASKVEKNVLHLKALPGFIWEKDATQKNLLARPLPAFKEEDGPLTVEAVVANKPEVDGEQAGIMLYLGDDHYLKLCRERVDGKLQLVFARELAGQATTVAQREDAAASHKMRIRWEGQKISAEVLPAGAPKWIMTGYCENPFKSPEGVKAVVYACGAPAAAARWAQISDFKIGHAAPVD